MFALIGELVRWYGPLLWLLLAAWLGLLLRARKEIREAFGPLLTPRAAAVAAALFAVSLAVRLCVYPRTHQVYFDEFEHLDIARNLARLGQFALSRASGLPGFDVLDAPPWPGGFHAMLAVVFKLFGFSETAAYAFNGLLGGGTVALTYLLGLALFEHEAAAGFGALICAALPLHLKYSGATDLTMASLFWIEAAALALVLWRRTGAARLGALCALAAVYSVNTRPENLILLPFLIYLAPRAAWSKRSLPLLAASAALLVPPALIAAFNASIAMPGYADARGAYALHLRQHLPGNLAYLFAAPLGLFVLAPAASAAFKRRREAAALGALSLAYLTLYSAYFLGAFGVASGDRYALPVLLPLLPLAGEGWRLLIGRLPLKPAAACLAAAAFVAASWPRYGEVGSARYEAEYRFIQESAASLSPDVYVLAFSPAAIIAAARRPAMRIHLLMSLDEYPALNRDEFYLFKDYWWYRDPAGNAGIESLLAGYDRALVAGRLIEGNEYGFWKLTRAKPAPRAVRPRSARG